MEWLKHTYITKHRGTRWQNGVVVREREEEVLLENICEVPERTKILLSFFGGVALAVGWDVAWRYLK